MTTTEFRVHVLLHPMSEVCSDERVRPFTFDMFIWAEDEHEAARLGTAYVRRHGLVLGAEPEVTVKQKPATQLGVRGRCEA